MGVVAFDPVAFLARYPEFSGASAALPGYFNEACLYLNNTDASRVQDVARRAVLLNMLTAHIAALNGSGASGQGAPGVVGRIETAAEGTVNVTAKYADVTSASMAFYVQTKYGAAYWAATARDRTFRYAVPRRG